MLIFFTKQDLVICLCADFRDKFPYTRVLVLVPLDVGQILNLLRFSHARV